MTDPKYAEKITGKGRWYRRPSTGELLVSVTNVLDVAIAKHGLSPWAAKLSAEHAWSILPRMVAASRRGPIARDEIIAEIKGRHDVVRDTASDLGTRVHRLAEAHVLGRPEPDDDEAAPYVDQYIRWLKDFGIDIERDVEASEITVLNLRYEYAGTADLLVWLPLVWHVGEPAPIAAPGERHLWLVDLKSSATRPASSIYESFPLQLTAYKHGEKVLLGDGTEQPMPRGIVGVATLNLRADDYAFIPLPSGQPEWLAFLGALATARWIHGDFRDGKPYSPCTITGSAKPRRARAKKDVA